MAKRIPDAKLFKVTEKLPQVAPQPEGQPDVTVITVVFNAVKSGREKPFLRCLESVQTQRDCNVEHLIIDGGSQDGTVEIVAGFANGSVPVRYVSQPDHGIYEAMNRGLALARGRFVVFLNSDDRFCRPDGMSVSVRALDSQKADYSYAPAYVVDADDRRLAHDFSKADEVRNLFCGMTVCHQTILIRRDVLLAADGFDLAYRSAADYDLFLRIIYAGHVGVRVETCFVEFLSGGFSSVNSDTSEREVDRIFQNRFRENFGVEMSEKVIRCIRLSWEYPVDLTRKILKVGERSLRRPLSPLRIGCREWEKGVRWSFRLLLPNGIWARYDRAPRLWTPLRQSIHCLAFSMRHPLHALGAVKAWAVHLKQGYAPLCEWFLVRCKLLVEDRYDTYRAVYPCDLATGVDALRKSHRGFVVTDAVRVPIPSVGRMRSTSMFVLLFPGACQEGEKTAEVRLNGRLLGRVVLRPEDPKAEHWSSFRLSPRAVDEATEAEIRLLGGGEFVFGGLCFCPGA